jgi:hypothetical protein
VTVNQKLQALSRRVVFGPSPELPASDLEKYLFIRRFAALLSIPLLISLGAGLAFGAPMWLWIVLGVGWAGWLMTAAELPFAIRRERRRELGD